jgi:hypothetical protein
MKKLWSTFLKDMKISFNGLYFYMEVGFAVIFVLIMLFVVPENFDRSQTLHMTFDAKEPYRSQLMEQFTAGNDTVVLHDSVDSVKTAMEKDRSSAGVSIIYENSVIGYEIILQGYESERMISMMKAVFEGQFLSEFPGYKSSVTSVVLQPDSVKLTDREHIIPVYLTMNIALMGLFIIAAYIFLDKEEGVIRAFAVTPVKIWQYLFSKMMIMALMGMSTTLLVCLTLVGTHLNYPVLLLSVLAFNLFGSSLGLLISSFFDSISKAMGVLYFTIMLMMVAGVSYFMPSFSPFWIRLLPSYPMLFSFRELLLPNGNIDYAIRSAIAFILFASILFAYANIRFKKTLTV